MKYWDDDKLKSEYELISNHIKHLLIEVRTNEELKEQLKLLRKYKKQLQIELELRGLI